MGEDFVKDQDFIEFVFEDGHLKQAITRGNGFEGLIKSQLNYRLRTSIYDYKQARTVNIQCSCC